MDEDLGTILQALHDSDIGGTITWVNGMWQVELGDMINGFKDHEFVESASMPPSGSGRRPSAIFPTAPFRTSTDAASSNYPRHMAA